MIGLGRMGGSMSRRLMKAEHVVFARGVKTRAVLAKERATATAAGLEGVVKPLVGQPRAIWMVLPSGSTAG